MTYYLLIAFLSFSNLFSDSLYESNISHNSQTNEIQVISSLVIEETQDKDNKINSTLKYSFDENLDEMASQKKCIRDNIKQRKKTITISFAGDCTLGYDETFSYHNSFPFTLEKENDDYGYFFNKVKRIFENDDLTIVNLETTLTKETKKADKKFRFKGDPSYVNILKSGSIEMVNIANNHIYDYLNKGFLDTINNLQNAGVLYSGEGYIQYYSVQDVTIASIGYRGWSTNIKGPLTKDIEDAKEKADIIIVSFHWGSEYTYYPNQAQTSLGRFAIDSGADIVIGHHPHVIQGIEKYKDRYIVYSLGNFSFGGNKNPRDKDTIIFQNEFTVLDKKIIKSKGHIIPCSLSSVKNINNYQPIILQEDEGKRVIDRIYKYSSKLKYGIMAENKDD